MVDTAVFVLECLGAIAFTLSGIIVSIERRVDPIGTFVISFTTAFGGGIIRDLLIGVVPPSVFCNPSTRLEALIAMIVGMIFYIFAFFKKTAPLIIKMKNDIALNIIDAVGLSVFCISGVKTAIAACGGGNILLLIVAGSISGCGGSILRDIFTDSIPTVFRKHVYILPSIIGSSAYVLLYTRVPQLVAMMAGIAIIITIRVLAIVYKWNLPIPREEKDRSAK